MTAAEIIKELRAALSTMPRPIRRPFAPPLTASDGELDRAARDEFVERARLLTETWDGK